MTSLKLGLLTKDKPRKAVHYVEIVTRDEGLEELEFDPRTNDDNRGQTSWRDM